MRSLWGHLRSLEVTLGSLGVTWGHLMALVVPFGVTLESLALAWRALRGHLGQPLGVTWGHLGPLVNLFGATLGSLGLQIGPKIA